MMGHTETQGNRFMQPIPEGSNVFDVNGEKVGSVSRFSAQGEYLTIQKGWLLTHDIYVPTSSIGRVVASEVHLNLSKDALKDQRWATPPPSRPESHMAGMGLTGAPPAPEEGRVEPVMGSTEAPPTPEEGRIETERSRMEETRATAGREEDIRLPMRKEEFVVGKQAAEPKHLHLHKHVVEEQATSSVPITHEEVRIERVPFEEEGLASDEYAFSEQDLDIPLNREEVVRGKRVIANEEVRIHKESVTEVEEVSGTVRKELWRVEGAESQDQEIPLRETDEQSALGGSETV